MSVSVRRYHGVAIALHWLMALALVGLFGAGLWMTDLPLGTLKFEIYQLHKSLGITVLLLALVRLGWRFTHPVPAAPPAMTRWEQAAARASHVAFYALMIGIPLAGWAMVSVSVWNVPTVLYGLIPWPHLPLGGPDKVLEGNFKLVHEWLAIGLMTLLVLHVGAALRHHFALKDDVLARMVPGLTPKG
jgi:cytochrome b561